MWELDHKESQVPKNWCFQIVVLEKTLEGLLDSKEMKPVNPKGNQPWIFIGRTKAEAPIIWPLDEKSRIIGKVPDAGKDWRQKKSAAEDERLDVFTDSMDINLSKLWVILEDRGAWHAAGVTKSQTWLSDWATIMKYHKLDGLQQQKFLSHSSGVNQVENPGVNRAMLSLILSCFLPPSGSSHQSLMYLGLWEHHSNLCPSLHMTTFPCVCLCLLFL